MRAGLENTGIRRVLAALLLSGLLLVAGASAAGADGYGSDGDPHYGSTYPVPEGPPATPTDAEAPPVLARTGSSSGTMVAAGVGALLAGGGLVLVARRRNGRAALAPA
jgi:LPXTG-motif cell wall-anchored protein